MPLCWARRVWSLARWVSLAKVEDSHVTTSTGAGALARVPLRARHVRPWRSERLTRMAPDAESPYSSRSEIVFSEARNRQHVLDPPSSGDAVDGDELAATQHAALPAPIASRDHSRPHLRRTPWSSNLSPWVAPNTRCRGHQATCHLRLGRSCKNGPGAHFLTGTELTQTKVQRRSRRADDHSSTRFTGGIHHPDR